jgi:hypothetical protein
VPGEAKTTPKRDNNYCYNKIGLVEREPREPRLTAATNVPILIVVIGVFLTVFDARTGAHGSTAATKRRGEESQEGLCGEQSNAFVIEM